ncbi:methionine--tRNA ligase [Candidatus Berkiella aquae]|uniref:Methionine--tRNA ligase n=1 Tax=Candidatus Berkiella aquae TaxID=295108 RepID=A0A0Q9YUJ9_9GAMM|nr:methionine--tRNA ligase [Candidatus Berkiella aquae]MCS5710962.1 methionine--tRNA ligase [Candidatus Berkiella aquae]
MPNTPNRQILVTSALPYANGPLHLGHMVEYIQSDIWVRWQLLMGNQCIHICGSDAHGTPIMLQAEKLGITPENLVSQIHAEHKADFAAFHVAFNNFYTTHSPENQELSAKVYQRLKARGDITTKEVTQAYDPVKNMFLPDRYVKGECPKCGAKDQYGDSCEVCGATYSPTELKNPISVVSGAKPEERSSEHYFFKLENYTELLQQWTQQEHFQPQIANKLQEWFEAGLRQWDISRDGPYFGFPIPETTNKYFYVWMDAPIGYMASFKNWCEKQPNVKFDDFWAKNSPHDLYHFIGKDIVYFHALFWPAMLAGSDFRTPTAIFAHGFLTINGQKMSKSRGTFITARSYLDHLHPEYLRYYFAAKLGDGIDDIDLNLNDFTQRVNSDLVGKFVNIASRCAGFISKHFDGKLANTLDDNTLFQRFSEAGESIQEAFLARHYHRAIREIMGLADLANQYVDSQKPWELAKNQETLAKVQPVCTMGLNCFRLLSLYLKPVLPQLVANVESFFNIAPLTWDDRKTPLLAHTINPYQPLIQRIDPKQIDQMLEKGKVSMSSTEPTQPADLAATDSKASNLDPIAAEITYDDFAKIDLRIAKIAHAEHVEGAEKLLKLTLDIGTENRQVFAGIKSAYQPEDLIGKLTVMVANLAPRQMRFGLSQGMVLAAGPGGKDLWILEPHTGAQPGMRVK